MNLYSGYPDELGLISLSWLVVNLKKKTIEGHCPNRNHKLIEGHPKCHVGNEFHKGFYNALANTLNELANFGSIQTPDAIGSETQYYIPYTKSTRIL
ncbi:MAG: hypothetical protein M3P08_04640 [Thermoproteota archaeon]|nr:hypothetical protein [Thermoproteota archaeon]